jgi:hypothetical protein
MRQTGRTAAQTKRSYAPTALFELVDVVAENLANALEVVQDSNFPTNELDNPDRHCIRFLEPLEGFNTFGRMILHALENH